MRCLLDTQILIWWFDSSPKLSSEFKDFIESSDDKFVSVISFWEIMIKMKLGKLRLKKSIDFILGHMEFKILDVNLEHVLAIGELPNIHKDPFDRMLIAQTMVEDLILLTADRKIKKYFRD